MNAAILLCAAMLAADTPAQVQAKVLYGTAAEQQHRADIDLWISQAVVKTGLPLAQPYTDWIALTGDFQRLYTSKQGGFIIDGKVTEKDGKYEVEIDACAGVPLDKKMTLKPGEHRVVKLTDNPAPNNVFIALEAPVSEQAKKRAEAMKANAKTFRFELRYNGEQDKPFYRMILSVPAVSRLRSSPFERIVQVKEDEANRIIDHLAREGFLDHAVDLRNKTKLPPPSMPCYTMKVAVDDMTLYEDLGWGLPMIHRLDALPRSVPSGQTMSFNPLSGRILTTFRAGLALKTVSSFVNGLIPLRAFVAGLRITFTFIRPGTFKTPGPRLPRLLPINVPSSSRTLVTSDLLRPVPSAKAVRNSVLVIGLAGAAAFFFAAIGIPFKLRLVTRKRQLIEWIGECQWT